MLQRLKIFKKLAYDEILYVWGHAQISDNKCSQGTRMIQSHWHNHFRGRSHTCQTQKNRSFVNVPGALAGSCCAPTQGRGNALVSFLKFLRPMFIKILNISGGVGFPSCGAPGLLLPKGWWRDRTRCPFLWDMNWAFLSMSRPAVFGTLILQFLVQSHN